MTAISITALATGPAREISRTPRPCSPSGPPLRWSSGRTPRPDPPERAGPAAWQGWARSWGSPSSSRVAADAHDGAPGSASTPHRRCSGSSATPTAGFDVRLADAAAFSLRDHAFSAVVVLMPPGTWTTSTGRARGGPHTPHISAGRAREPRCGRHPPRPRHELWLARPYTGRRRFSCSAVRSW